MSFRSTIIAIKQVANCYENGLQALQSNSSKIMPSNSRHCEGSLDIDSCLHNIYPNAARWDYIISYNSKVYCIEIHPATGGEANSIINKVNWLKGWLKTTGISIVTYNGNFPTCHWIASGKVSITRDSNYARKLAEAGVKFPQEILRIPYVEK